MFKTYSIEVGGRTLSVDIGRVSAQANGAAFMHYGDTTVLSTATASEKPRDGIDFFPLSVDFSLSCIGEGNSNPLQYSCLENPRDGGAWWAAVYGVAQSWKRLK